MSNLSSVSGMACLQTLADESNFEELQYQLYIREIQRLNPSLREGCLFVDGLYELVCSQLPVQVGREGEANLKNGARDLLTLNSSDILLLQKYWHQPQDPDEYTAYLTVACSFVSYVVSQYGSQAVSEFLQQLDYTMDDPLVENFRFKRQGILKLEFKWKKFVEAEVNSNFRLSVFGMLHMLFTRYLLKYWLRLIIVLALILADVGLEFLYSLAFAQLISLGFSRSSIDLQALFKWIGVLIATLMVRFAVLLVSAGVLVSIAVSVSNRIRKSLSERFRSVTPLYLADHSTSSLLTTFSQDVNTVEKVISNAVRAIAVALVLVMTCFIYCAIIVWPLAIYLAGLFIISQLLNHFVSRKLSIYLFGKGQANGKMCDILKEQIDGFLVSRIYRLAQLWKGQLQDTIQCYYTKQARNALFFTNFCWFFQQMVPNVSIATMLFGINLLARAGYTDFTSGVSVFLFYIRVSVGLTAAASMFPELQSASTAMGRINALLNNKSHEINPSSEGGGDHSRTRGSMQGSYEEPPPDGGVLSLPVEFRGVCFSYKMSAAHWNLYNVTLEIKAGERVVIVGTSGSGKSTLLMLAMQLYTPSVGEVILGGGKSPYYCGIPKISTTFQTNHMFNMSLRENIRLGNLAASNEEVEEAARKADIHDWIMTQARGYDTPVQSGGSSLSGGQRQRIAIARMIVAKSPICLLDEVTSALDPSTESRVFARLMEVTKGRTVLAVTHKLKQAKFFDRIVVMSHGRVKEMGSHSGLLAHRGAYWRMVNNNMTVSPGRPMAIPRRRSSGSLHIDDPPPQPPQLSTILISNPRRVAGRPTPTFVPLQPLTETEESSYSHTRSHTNPAAGGSGHTSPPDGVELLPASTAPTSQAAAVNSDTTRDMTGSSIDEQSCIPRRASTPVICAGQAGARSASSVDEETDMYYTTTESPRQLLSVQGTCAERVPTEHLQVGPLGGGGSKSMEETLSAAVNGRSFEANQTLPPRLVKTQFGTGLRRHPTMKFHCGPTTQGGTLREELEKVLRSENSLASLASFFDMELSELEEAGRSVGGGEGGGGGGEGEGDTYTETDTGDMQAMHC